MKIYQSGGLIPSAPPSQIQVGDKFTIAGVNRSILNPDRRWWQFWRPQWITTDEPKVFTVSANCHAPDLKL